MVGDVVGEFGPAVPLVFVLVLLPVPVLVELVEAKLAVPLLLVFVTRKPDIPQFMKAKKKTGASAMRISFCFIRGWLGSHILSQWNFCYFYLPTYV